jgi:hypothetical protein
MYGAVGLIPLQPFTAPRARRLTRCMECSVELTYNLEMVSYSLSGRNSLRCDWCRQERLGEVFRANARIVDEASLGSSDPSRLSGAALLKYIERRVWPKERVLRHFQSLHMKCVVLPPPDSDGFDPVHVRCTKCESDAIHLPARTAGEIEHGWCACDRCGGGKGPCPEDVVRSFEWHGLKVTDDHVNRFDKLNARCMRCNTPRIASLEQLRHDVVPCYVCDGAADPTKPHRVYLFHFKRFGCYKVGVTNSSNDDRLWEHDRRGGVLVEVVPVSIRAAAYALEQRILSAMAAYPSTVGPGEFPQNGWTETWSDRAPNISLAELAPTVAGVAVPREVIEQWHQHQRSSEVAGSGGSFSEEALAQLSKGSIVVFTGSDAIGRSVWKERAKDCGLLVRSSVTVATSILVAGDPTATTQKVRDAHLYGVPVIGYDAFARLLDAMAAAE